MRPLSEGMRREGVSHGQPVPPVQSQSPLGNHPAQASPGAPVNLWQLVRTAGVGGRRMLCSQAAVPTRVFELAFLQLIAQVL